MTTGGIYDLAGLHSPLPDEAQFPAGSVLPLEGIYPGGVPFLVTLLQFSEPGHPLLIVTGGTKAQELFYQDLLSWDSINIPTRQHPPDYFPSWEVQPIHDKLPQVETLGERIQTLLRLRAHFKHPCVVTQVDSILQKTFSPKNLDSHLRTLQTSESLDPLELLDWLDKSGYDSVAKVSQKGEFAVRGGIVDVYPISAPWPLRVEFFGNEIDSIREFDPNTQLSRDQLKQVIIPPAGELGILKRQLESLPADSSALQKESIATCLTNYFPNDTLLIIADPGMVWENLNLFRSQVEWNPMLQEWEFLVTDFLKRGGRIILAGVDSDIFDPRNLVGDGAQILPPLTLQIEPPELHCPPPVEPTLEMQDAYHNSLFKQIQSWKVKGYHCAISYSNEGDDARIKELWSEAILGQRPPTLTHAAISKGVILPDSQFALISDNDIFCRRRVHRSRRLKKVQATVRSQLEIDFNNIEEGDLVVHLQHGIAKYHGIGRMPTGAGRKTATTDSPECLILEYAKDDPFAAPPMLYVPVTEAHLVSKYIGVGRARPPLSRLGGKRWGAARAQAEKAVADIASDLLRVQAIREAEQGFAFPADSDWQHAFENAFEFEETPDQLKAIIDTKKDMESKRPMDRLVCGDVGFGKTEVAVRAAFKAVLAGKQVAVLAPTTVLVQQHFNTFRERMAGYPFRIESISRFKSRKAQDHIIAQVAHGDIDIIIGTHRLIQSDIRFKELGLFIIDEEQRFGVQQKERIKELKALTDVLTLTATPIPRTLYLALTGVKSMSSIETPPQERLPVNTTVCQYDERIIRDAIQREMNRQGQVFFLHNRVTSIKYVEERLKALVPKARIAVGHGQMSSDELEEVMTRFVNGEVDVLLSTTIIESGLDIPNANTIIIDRADRFGLSELYQLRGRVGRYRNQAYAYLLIPRHASLLSDARKRISAIKQYSRLGSGFKIAMRDLEIRGAGNILGAEQSGHITAIGFDLYCKLLQESISKFKGEKPVPHCETKVIFDFLTPTARTDTAGSDGVPESLATLESQLPLDYITDPVQRLEIYRRLAQTREITEVDAIEIELIDRFGKFPTGVQYLLETYRIRAVAGHKGITEIESRENKIIITRHGLPLMIHDRFPQFTKKTPKGRLKELLFLVKNLSDSSDP